VPTFLPTGEKRTLPGVAADGAIADVVGLNASEREGMFAMITLRSYCDDSGTHGHSRIVCMGGLVGSVAQWQELERNWAAKLAEPLPGKPRLKMFHLAACNAHDGEFRDYSPAEQDWITREFRQIIIDAKLIGFASSIDVQAWKELGADRLGYPALSYCVDYCVQETIRIANPHPEGDAIAIVFDRGMWVPKFKEVTDPYTYPVGRPRVVSITALSVADCLPLQASDIVATENYWHACKWLDLGDDFLPRPHMRHYLENMMHQGVILDRPAIEALLSEHDPLSGGHQP
jgi:hypothetical protein